MPPDKEINFRYFLDGSFRSYFLGVLSEGIQDTPVYFSQVGACVLRREDDGSVRIEELRLEDVLLVGRSCISGRLWSRLKESSSESGIRLLDLAEGEVIGNQVPGYELRGKAEGKVRYALHRLEGELIRDLLPRLGPECWLVVDGSLLFEPAFTLLRAGKDTAPVLGVAKSFRKDPHFLPGPGSRSGRRSVYGLLSDLGEGCRTAAFAAWGGKLAFWYVRLRARDRLEHPFLGVVKAELVNPTGKAVHTGFVDRLSLSLLEERATCPHGQSGFWHAHLYPVFLAERVVKENLLSREVVGNIFKGK